MLRTHLKLNFVFGTNTDECKERILVVYLQDVRITKGSFSKLLKSVSKSTGDNRAEDELF